jgi:hypothetical protein
MMVAAHAAPLGLLGVDRHDNRLRAELFRRAGDDHAVRHGGRIDGHLVGAGQHQGADIFHGPNTATDRHRHEAGFGRAGHDIENGAAIFMRRRDVEEAELVGASRVIGLCCLYGIAGVDQVDELHALDDTSVMHVQAGNDPGLQHQAVSRASRISLSASAGSSRPS